MPARTSALGARLLAGVCRFWEPLPAMMGRTVRTPEKGERLLKQLALGKSISAACRAEKIGRTTFYDWKDADPEFAARVDDAIEQGTDRLEDAAMTRAVKGDATLTIFLLKARRPDKYRETIKQDHGGVVQHRHQHEHRHYDLSRLSDDELIQLRALAMKLEAGEVSS